MDEYVAKPIHMADVFSAMAKALGRKSRSGRPDEPAPAATGDAEDETRSARDGAVVDWAAALDSVRGDRDLLREVVEAALEDIPRQVAAIIESARHTDATALRMAAHGLKGAVRYFGEVALYDVALCVETHASRGEVKEAADLLPSLEREADQVCVVLRDHLQNSPAA
jgi:HPt (histidine-containing phosphotransfer) domain-containing protein